MTVRTSSQSAKTPSAPQQAPATPTFEQLGVAVEIVDALAQNGITHTFAIQELTLPIALDGTDLIGQARTGMGKTLAFGIPLLDRVFDDAAIPELDGTPRALVIAPTRELASQVTDDLRMAASELHAPDASQKGGRRRLEIATIFGGHSIDKQIDQLTAGVDVVVGTPGRLLDLHQRGALNLDSVAILVLDEADEMLDLGFLPDIEKILAALPTDRQTMLFSATMPGPIMNLARNMMNKPVNIRAEGTDDSATHTSTTQLAFKNHKMDKIATLTRILQARDRKRTIIFTRTKRSAKDVAEDLAHRGFSVGAVHGDLNQAAREKALAGFRENRIDVLVATDVAARGIDVDDVSHVINYQVPDDPMTYVHRIGRTGRAGRSGVAVTLVGWDETAKWESIDESLNLSTLPLPEWFSTSPELGEALDIPSTAGETVAGSKPVLGATSAATPRRPTARRNARSSAGRKKHS